MRDLAPCIFSLSFPARFPFAAGCRFKARRTFSPFVGNAIKTWEFVAHLHRLFFHFYLQLPEEIAAFLGKSNLLPNWKSLGHLDPRKTLIFGISGYYSHVILSHSIWGGGGGAQGLAEGCVKIMLFVSCLECLTCLQELTSFIMVECEKLQPQFKNVLIFLVTKVFQKGAMFRWVYV